MFASLAGYFVCFWPGDHPTRRVLSAVCLPAIGGFSLMLSRFLYLSRTYSSVLDTTGKAVPGTTWVESLWKLPPGFHFCLMGLLLVLVFTSRLAFRIATLPLALPQSSVLKSEDDESWRRVQVLVWVLVGALFLLYMLLGWLTMGIPIVLSSRLPAYLQSTWFSRAMAVLELLPLGFVLWIAGRENRQVLRTLIRVPQYAYFVIALAFPIGIDALIPTGQYLVDRVAWAAHDFGKLDAPLFRSYFAVQHPWFLLFFLSSFFPAFFEEMIFRGVLQSRFLRRYGLYRGIFLVGMVWAAFHFFSDFSFSRVPDQDVVFQLGFRVFMCVAQGFVLGWLTLRSRSVFPAAIAHTCYNVLIYSRLGLDFPGKGVVQMALWGLLAVILFRHWPVRVESEPSLEVAEAAPEPAG
jgi:membrane protease YdiL (CAAX protease family)